MGFFGSAGAVRATMAGIILKEYFPEISRGIATVYRNSIGRYQVRFFNNITGLVEYDGPRYDQGY